MKANNFLGHHLLLEVVHLLQSCHHHHRSIGTKKTCHLANVFRNNCSAPSHGDTVMANSKLHGSNLQPHVKTDIPIQYMIKGMIVNTIVRDVSTSFR